MSDAKIKSENLYGSVQLEQLDLIDSSGASISLILVFKTLIINEGLHGVFYSGFLSFNSEYDVRGMFPLIGKEYLQIAWRTNQTDPIRRYRFRIVTVPSISEITGFTREYGFYFVSDDFLQIDTKYYQCYDNKSVRDIYSDMLSRAIPTLKINNLANESELISIYLNQVSIFENINLLRSIISIPHVWYQRDNDLFFEPLTEFSKKYSAYQFNTKDSDLVYRVTEIRHHDIYDIRAQREHGSNGYQHFNYNPYTGNLSIDRIQNIRNISKNEIDTINSCFRRNISSKGIYQYFLSDFIKGAINYGISELKVGDKLLLPEYSDELMNKTCYHGEWQLTEITHTITSGFKYKQDITASRFELNR